LTRVHVVTTGGTIAMTGTPARPARSGDELVAAVPELATIAEPTVEELSNVPGVELDAAAVVRALVRADAAVADGAAGCVITQGTDTIEESADIADLLWPRPEPLCLTGAMVPGGNPGTDAPDNLRDAVRVAASAHARGRGALVVFAGLIHSGSEAVKSHSSEKAAFHSPRPLGEVRGESIVLRGTPAPRSAVAPLANAAAASLDAYVPVLAAAAGMDSRPLAALLDQGADALVLIALGGGHVAEAMLPGIDAALARGVPVIACARPAAGGTLEGVYGFPGSETDLQRRGVLMAGPLSPWKARARAILALGLGMGPDAVLAHTATRSG
jgi:L-asparaginase